MFIVMSDWMNNKIEPMTFSNQRVASEFADDTFYFADKESLSNSMLGILDDSPEKFNLFMQGKWSYPSADYFDIGTAVHQMFLEDVDNRIKIDGTRRTKAYKEAKEENPDKLVLPTSDYDLTENMVSKLHKVPQLKEFMGGFAEQRPEVAATATVTTSKGNTISVKGKADMLLSDGFGTPVLMDLKTSAKDLNQWKRNAWYGSYPRQAYLYSNLFEVEEFYFVVITKTFPYDVGIFKASEAFLKKGKEQFEKSITQYEKLFIEGDFQPYSAVTGTL